MYLTSNRDQEENEAGTDAGTDNNTGSLRINQQWLGCDTGPCSNPPPAPGRFVCLLEICWLEHVGWDKATPRGHGHRKYTLLLCNVRRRSHDARDDVFHPRMSDNEKKKRSARGDEGTPYGVCVHR
jgi:hypothetical protein